MSNQHAVAQRPMVVYSYWLSRQPDEPHIGYGIRQRRIAHGLTGLALSGGVFGSLAAFGFNLPAMYAALAALALGPLMLKSDAGWYIVDENGVATTFLGHEPPLQVRGRVGVRHTDFLKYARTNPVLTR